MSNHMKNKAEGKEREGEDSGGEKGLPNPVRGAGRRREAGCGSRRRRRRRG